MADGLIIYGDNSKIQITDEYPIYQEGISGTIGLFPAHPGYVLFPDSEFNFVTDILAVHCNNPDNYFVPRLRNAYATAPLPVGVSAVLDIPLTTNPQSTYEYRVYRLPDSINLPNFGLKIWNAIGRILFRSDRKVFNATAAANGEFPPQVGTATIAAPGTAKPAIVLGKLPISWGGAEQRFEDEFVWWEALFSYTYARTRPNAVDLQRFSHYEEVDQFNQSFTDQAYNFLVTTI